MIRGLRNVLRRALLTRDSVDALEHASAAVPYPAIDWRGPTWSETGSDRRRGAGQGPCAPGGCDWCRERARQPEFLTEVDRG